MRRNSTDPDDLFLAHIGGMDAFARGLEVAAKLLDESPLEDIKQKRYASFAEGDGLRFSQGQLGLADLAKLAAQHENLPLDQRQAGDAREHHQPVSVGRRLKDAGLCPRHPGDATPLM